MDDQTEGPHESVFGSLCTTQFKKCVFRFKWTINEFSFYRGARDSKIVSSIFSDGTDDGLKWHLEVGVFPESSTGRNNMMNLRLDSDFSNINSIDTKCKLAILNAKLKEVNTAVHDFTFKKETDKSLFIYDLISEVNLFKSRDLLPNDTLTIFCEISCNLTQYNEDLPGSLTIPARIVPNNLLPLLENPELSDITLCADGKEIQAHKAILAARSNVFRAMFQNVTKENQTNIVNIPDVDYEILEKLLRFIYTDTFPDLHTVTNVMNLLSVTDKYELDRLKLRCEEELGRNLSDENAVECYIAANKVKAEHLKASTKSYIIVNVTGVSKTSGFALLVHDHPDLVVEALRLRIEKSPQSLQPTINSVVETVPRLQKDLLFESLCSTYIKTRKYETKLTIPSFSFYCNALENELYNNTMVSCKFSDGTDDGLKWDLEFNPFNNYLNLKLFLVSSTESSLNAMCKFSILNSKLEKFHEKSYANDFESKEILEISKFIAKDVLFNNQDECLPDDELTILCEIITAVSNENISRELTIPACHANNLGLTLLENPEFSDITLHASGKEIQAHKVVLSARSNVFRAMFQHDMKESQTNRVDIQDVEYEILKRMIYIIYTDEFPNIENVADLMQLSVVADKYELHSVMQRCEEMLAINLTDKNAVEYYITADRVNAENLKLLIKSFIIANFHDIAKTSGLALLVQTYPDLVIEASL